MDVVTVDKISYQKTIPYGRIRSRDSLMNFSGEFYFGRTYLLNAPFGKGAWALCWIIGGAVKEQSGSVKKNGSPFLIHERRRESWLVRYSEVRRFGLFSQSIKAQIQQGLHKARNQHLQSEEELLNRLNLSPERFSRPLSQFSSEGWRASCAIGLAHGKRIFCFPHIEYSYPELIGTYRDLWFAELLDLLKASGALVLLPTLLTEAALDLCDEIIEVSN